MNINEIINRISYFRNQKKLSARELSLLIGKSEPYINKLEAKDFNLPTNVLLDILAALEISTAEFFADNYKTYEIDKQLFDLISSLDNERKLSLINLIKK